MRNKVLTSLLILVLFVFSLQACGAQQPVVQSTSTATVTPSPSATPTFTLTPSKTPRPSATPNATKTHIYNELFSQVERFQEEGLIPETKGEFVILGDFEKSVAKMGWLQYRYTNFKFKHFVYHGHVEWSTSIDTNKTSGCGVVFALQIKESQNEYFGVIMDKSRIFFSAIRGGHYYDLGKTRGSGHLNFGNPAEADLTLLVYDHKAFVYVDDEFIGEYTLPQKSELYGNFGFGIISGTNHDYGTKCKITDSRVWELAQ